MLFKVLIVDDDVMICKGLRKLIPWDDLGGQVVGMAHNGQDAIELVKAHQPDIIISDIKMPVVDGLGLSQYVYENYTNTSIILLSAHEEFEYARKALRYGVVNYMVKPLNKDKIDQLVDEIASVMESKERKNAIHKAEFRYEIDEEVNLIIGSGNIDELLELLNKKFEEVGNNNEDIYLLCIKFVQVIFDNLRKIGVNNEVIKLSEDSALDEIMSLKKPELMKDRVYQIYTDILQFELQSQPDDKKIFIQKAKDYINDNYSNIDMSVSMVAEYLDLSLNYLSNSFRKVTGVNMTVYITDLRMKAAGEMLKTTNKKITTIAEAVGYNDSRYFSKVYKKETGMTPSEYRTFYLNFVESGEEDS